MASTKSILGSAETVLVGLLGLGLVGILYLIIYGNLAGNLGFAENTLGANNTNMVINNLTGGVVTFFGFANTLFTLTAITLLIGIILVVLRLVRGNRETGGFSQ
jgi:hypothetical protein|tara:strand:- start:14751 stop:15062 length:312 start_codon:yes stop_codon:yes gene_type:complete